MSSPDDAYDLARATLDALVAAYAAAAYDLPSRQYAHAGEIAWDCEEVVVTMGRTFGGEPGAERVAVERAQSRTLELHPSIIRCAPHQQGTDSPPTAADLDDFAKVVGRDLIFVPMALRKAVTDKTLYETCQAVAWTTCSVQGPEGGYVGVVLDVQVQL